MNFQQQVQQGVLTTVYYLCQLKKGPYKFLKFAFRCLGNCLPWLVRLNGDAIRFQFHREYFLFGLSNRKATKLEAH